MATPPLSGRRCTLDAFLDFEESAETPHEWIDGTIFPMSAGTDVQSALCVRITSFLSRFFPQCKVFDGRLMLFVEMIDRPVYPDAMLLCGETRYYKTRRTVITNPSLVVEVLSPSSKKKDRGSKTDYYRSVASIQDILLVHQDCRLIEHFERGSERWTITPYSSGTTIRVSGQEIAVNDVYAGVLP